MGNDFYYERALNQYKEAEERVLFDDVEKSEHDDGMFFVECKNGVNFSFYDNETIEELVCFDLELTDNAEKQLGL